MKLIFAVIALATAAFAAPGQEKRWACTPATYSCTPDTTGWQVCDTSGNWVVSPNPNPAHLKRSLLIPHSLPAAARHPPGACSSHQACRHTACLPVSTSPRTRARRPINNSVDERRVDNLHLMEDFSIKAYSIMDIMILVFFEQFIPSTTLCLVSNMFTSNKVQMIQTKHQVISISRPYQRYRS
jgi:hypothetical protein